MIYKDCKKIKSTNLSIYQFKEAYQHIKASWYNKLFMVLSDFIGKVFKWSVYNLTYNKPFGNRIWHLFWKWMQHLWNFPYKNNISSLRKYIMHFISATPLALTCLLWMMWNNTSVHLHVVRWHMLVCLL